MIRISSEARRQAEALTPQQSSLLLNLVERLVDGKPVDVCEMRTQPGHYRLKPHWVDRKVDPSLEVRVIVRKDGDDVVVVACGDRRSVYK